MLTKLCILAVSTWDQKTNWFPRRPITPIVSGNIWVRGAERLYANMLPDINEAIRDYDSGKFIFAPTGGGDTLDDYFYGEAVISGSYIRKNGLIKSSIANGFLTILRSGGADYRSPA